MISNLVSQVVHIVHMLRKRLINTKRHAACAVVGLLPHDPCPDYSKIVDFSPLHEYYGLVVLS